MFSWPAWVELMRSLSPLEQVRSLLLAGSVFTCIAPSFLAFLSTPTEPANFPSIRLPATLASEMNAWKYDDRIYETSIYFQVPGARRTKRYIYLYRSTYDFYNINKSTPLFVEIQHTPTGITVRRLLAGTIELSNSLLQEHINSVNDRKVLKALFWFSTLGALCFVGAGAIHCLNRRKSAAVH